MDFSTGKAAKKSFCFRIKIDVDRSFRQYFIGDLELDGSHVRAQGHFATLSRFNRKISQTHLDFNLLQIQNLASQKADFVSGAALVLIAFLIQMFAVLFVREPFPIFEDYWSAAGVAFAVSVVIAIVFFGVNGGMSKHYQEQAKFTLAKSYFQTVLNQDPILPQHLKIAEEVALSLFGMGKQPDESGRAYFTRLAKKLEIS